MIKSFFKEFGVRVLIPVLVVVLCFITAMAISNVIIETTTISNTAIINLLRRW